MTSTVNHCVPHHATPPRSHWYYSNVIPTNPIECCDALLAFGLHIEERELIALKLSVSKDLSRTFVDGKQLVKELFKAVDSKLEDLPDRFPDLPVPIFWKCHAIAAICGKIVDYCDGKWAFKLPKSPRKLPYDCLARIFDFVGLKPGTIKAIARGLEMGKESQDALLLHRCSPVRLFSVLVKSPQELIGVMADSNVWLVGSRATSYFYPNASTECSDWNFMANGHINSSIRFAAYLASQGVVWTAGTRRHTLRGTSLHRGSSFTITLGVFQTSQQAMDKTHSSAAQCFISGYAAVCMHAHLTVSGFAKAWETRVLHQIHQQFLDKYHARGVVYLRHNAPFEAHKVPRVIQRTLSDHKIMVVPFVRYLNTDLDARASNIAKSALWQLVQYRWTDAVAQTFSGLIRLETMLTPHETCTFSKLSGEVSDLIAAVSRRLHSAHVTQDYGREDKDQKLEIALASLLCSTSAAYASGRQENQSGNPPSDLMLRSRLLKGFQDFALLAQNETDEN